MKDNKQLTEQELDQVSGGVLNPDSMFPNPRGRRGIIVPNYKVGFESSNPTPHPGPQVSGRYGVINPDSM